MAMKINKYYLKITVIYYTTIMQKQKIKELLNNKNKLSHQISNKLNEYRIIMIFHGVLKFI